MVWVKKYSQSEAGEVYLIISVIVIVAVVYTEQEQMMLLTLSLQSREEVGEIFALLAC